MHQTLSRLIAAALLLAASAAHAAPLTAHASQPAAADVYAPDFIATIMRKVADTALINQKSPDIDKENDWSIGALRTGITATYRVTGDEKYLKSNITWGDATKWTLKNPKDNADDECAGQTYCETYLLNPVKDNEHMYLPTKEAFDGMVLKPGFKGMQLWNWEDSLFMSPPVVAMLGKITGNKAYFDALVSGWGDTASQLYDPERHLWHFRGSPEFKKTPKGNPKFWGPGNAWVLAGVRRCLNYIPDDYEKRGELMKYFKDMAEVIASKQQEDGYWHTSLWEPTEFPDPESSCTSFFTYAIGMGILHGDLDEKIYLPVVKKGWAAVVKAVDDKGAVGRCQPWSNSPGGAPLRHNTPEGTGAFMLAGEAMYRLQTRDATTKPTMPASAPTTQSSVLSTQSSPSTQSTVTHKFACTDYTGGKVFVVSAEGKIEWEFNAAGCNDIQALPNGNLLFNDDNSVKEVSPDKKVVWSFTGKTKIYACQRLADGNTFVAECDSGRLLEIDLKGAVAKEVHILPEGKTGGGAFMRNARKLDNGHYLVAHYGGGTVKEYDDTGKEVWSVKAEGGAHSAVRLPNGNTLIACTDGTKNPRVIEVDPAGKTVWEIKNGDLPNITLKFMAGLERLKNGNTVMTNWQGHGKLGESEDIIEVTPDKKVVWTFSNHAHMKTVSSIIILDAEGAH